MVTCFLLSELFNIANSAKSLNKHLFSDGLMSSISITLEDYKEYQDLKREVVTLRNTHLYLRLLDCIENLKTKSFTRKDLGI